MIEIQILIDRGARYAEILLSAALFSTCIYLALFGKPQPPDYSGWERDARCLGWGALSLFLAADVWINHPKLRRLLVAALVLALLPPIVAVINAPFTPF